MSYIPAAYYSGNSASGDGNQADGAQAADPDLTYTDLETALNNSRNQLWGSERSPFQNERTRVLHSLSYPRAGACYSTLRVKVWACSSMVAFRK